MSIHKSKGLEFDTVILVGLEDYPFRGLSKKMGRNDFVTRTWCLFPLVSNRSHLKAELVILFSGSSARKLRTA